MATFSNDSKNNTVWTNDPHQRAALIWNDADFSWNNAQGTWSDPHDVFVPDTKNTTPWSNDTKN